MARKKPHEEHENHERYLVTYSDLITLLLAFFIILYAMSSVDQDKFDAFSQSLSVAFNHGTTSPIEFDGTYNKNARKEATQEELKEIKDAKENNQLKQVKEKIDKVISDKKLTQQIETKLDDEGLHIILTNEILFESGDAKVKPQMRSVLRNIALLIDSIPNEVSISGHTDNLPISTPLYPSNWELSAARAVSVLKETLKSDPNLKPNRLSAAGYGEHHPAASNNTEKGRQKNRRVEILIKREITSVESEQEVTS
ncbi:flagellar motor protein MotB [Priestia megaterium]|nr:flagellar motor protein MotB [Priestia megaterium]